MAPGPKAASAVSRRGPESPVRHAEPVPHAEEGCLAVAIRLPVRIVVLVLVVPVRMAWDLLTAGGRLLRDRLLRPLGRGLSWLGHTLIVRPLAALGRGLAWLGRVLVLLPLQALGRALAWSGRTLVVAPLSWLLRTLIVAPLCWLSARVLIPLGRGLARCGRGLLTALAAAAAGIGTGIGRLARALFVLPWVALWRYALVPFGHALARLGHLLCVVPLRWLYRSLLTPFGHALIHTLRSLGRAGAWLLRTLLVLPLAWLYAQVLTPLGRGLRWCGRALVTGAGWLLKAVLVRPWSGLWRYVVLPVAGALGAAAGWLWDTVLTPLGRGLGSAAGAVVRGLGLLLRWILVVPFLALWRWVLAPVARFCVVVLLEIGDALGHAWRVAGRISRAVGRLLGRLLRLLFVEPVRWAYRAVLTPAGHFVRDAVWRPAVRTVRQARAGVREALTAARQSARQARAEVRRLLFGAPRTPAVEPAAGAPAEPGLAMPLPGADSAVRDPAPEPVRFDKA
ncbi:hypothetical protein [Streptomyces physcomitrii]|uniref:hypothetical protein n=1 Tax=Streptomyces physcomitrii TaxID=2724184 RepID=UPI001B2FFCEE|nr:hypothetical protein [Streptomyces physcomitrii]